MDFELLSTENKVQILLDWINTIDHPDCLLVSSLEDLRDGSVFCIIIDYFLKMLNGEDEPLEAFENFENMETDERYNRIIDVLSNFSDDQQSLYNDFQRGFYNNNKKLVDFTLMLKLIFDGSVSSSTNVRDNRASFNPAYTKQQIQPNTFVKDNMNYEDEEGGDKRLDNHSNHNSPYRKNDKIRYEDVEKYESPSQYINSSSNKDMDAYFQSLNNNSDKEHEEWPKANPERHFNQEKPFGYNFTKQEVIKNTISGDQAEKQFGKNRTMPGRFQDTKETRVIQQEETHISQKKNYPNIINDPSRNLYEVEKLPGRQQLNLKPVSETQEDKTQKLKIKTLVNPPTQKQNNHGGDRSKSPQGTPVKNFVKTYENPIISKKSSPIREQVIPTKPTHSPKPSTQLTTSQTSTNLAPTYTKREKSELYLFRGIPNSTNFEFSLGKEKIYHFIKPTNVILDINVTEKKKISANYSIDFTKNSIIKSKMIQKSPIRPRKEDEDMDQIVFNTTISKIPSTKSLIEVKQKKLGVDLDESSRFTERPLPRKEQIRMPQQYSTVTDSIPYTQKEKIYEWLVDTNLFKENSIKIEDIPELFQSGIFLSDLVNRLEGRQEVIKGIIRKVATKSQQNVNIRKVMDYLRSLEKFNTRHLWNEAAISEGNETVVWELLDDIWHHYTKRVKLEKKRPKSSANIPIPVAPKQLRPLIPAPVKNQRTNLKQAIRQQIRSNMTLDHYEEENEEEINKSIKKLDLSRDDHSNSRFVENVFKHNQENPSYTDTKKYQQLLTENISQILNTSGKSTQVKQGNSGSQDNQASQAKNSNLSHLKKLDVNVNSSRVSRARDKTDLSNSAITYEMDKTSSSKVNANSGLVPTPTNKTKEVRSNFSADPRKDKSRSKTPTKKDQSNEQQGFFITFDKTNTQKLKRELIKMKNDDEMIMPSIKEKELFSSERPEKEEDLHLNLNPTSTKRKVDFMQFNMKRVDDSYQSSVKPDSNSPSSASMLRYRNLPPSKTNFEKEVESIENWIYCLGIKEIRAIKLVNDIISEFRDGVLLCNILNILTNNKVTGVLFNPRSNASSLKNINKFLEVLRGRKDIPYDYLWSEEEILAGNGNVIRNLLKQMRKSFAKETEALLVSSNSNINR